MAIIASATNKREYPLLAEGQYLALCYGIVDEGEQYNKKYEKYSPKVRLLWELPEETIEINGAQVPRGLSKEYTLSLSEKSNLRKDLELWRGKKFTQEELRAFDLINVLGKPCMIQIMHTVADNGNTYANIGGVFAKPKSLSAPEPINPSVYLDWEADNFDKVLSELPEWIQDIVRNSNNWAERRSCQSPINTISETIDDEDLPF